MARKELLTAVAVLAQIPAIGSISGLPTLLNNEDVYKDPAVRFAVKPQLAIDLPAVPAEGTRRARLASVDAAAPAGDAVCTSPRRPSLNGPAPCERRGYAARKGQNQQKTHLFPNTQVFINIDTKKNRYALIDYYS